MLRKYLLACVAVAAMAFAAVPSYAADKELLVGSDTSFMPFEFQKDGKYVGFDVDLWDAVAKEAGIKYKLQPMDFNGIIPALQTHNLDAAFAGITIKDERKKVVDFSDPYYESGLSAITRADNKTVESSTQLDGKVIATKLATSSVDYLKANVKGADVRSFSNIDNAFLELQSGRVEVVVFDTPVVAYYVNTAGKGSTKLVNPPLRSGEFYGFAFPKGSDLTPKVNAALKTLKANGQYAAIYEKWFGKAP